MTSHFSQISLPDPNVRLTDLPKFLNSIRLSNDICLVGLGSRWNYACWQTWKALWVLGAVVEQHQQPQQSTDKSTPQSSPDSSAPTPTVTTAKKTPLLKSKSSAGTDIEKLKTVKVVLLDQDENIDFTDSLAVVGGTPMVLVYINGSMVPICRKDGPTQQGWVGSMNLEQVNQLLSACYRFIQEGAKADHITVDM